MTSLKQMFGFEKIRVDIDKNNENMKLMFKILGRPHIGNGFNTTIPDTEVKVKA